MSSILDTTNLAFAQITTSAKGAKTLPTLYKNGEAVTWQIPDPMEVPFEASAYNDPEGVANRVTLCLTPSVDVCEAMTALDAWCIQTLSQNPAALIGVQLTPEQVKERYVSCLKTSEKAIPVCAPKSIAQVGMHYRHTHPIKSSVNTRNRGVVVPYSLRSHSRVYTSWGVSSGPSWSVLMPLCTKVKATNVHFRKVIAGLEDEIH